jgi:hypothetical protein
MKRLVLLLFVISIGYCYAYDFPAGVPTEIFGLTITSSANLDIRPDIDITHAAIVALPHFEYLYEPLAIGLQGEGQANITVAQNLTYPLVSAYYGSSWHKATPYELIPMADMLLEQVDFAAGSEVILLICRNDPFLQVDFGSFTAVYHDTDPDSISLNWTTASETGLTRFKVFQGQSTDMEQIELIADVPATNTNEPTTYSYEVFNPTHGYTHFFWLQLADNLNFGGFYGPVSVSVAIDPPFVPQNKVHSVIPNPCGYEFWCTYELKDSSLVSILLLDSDNNVVKELLHKASREEGSHMFRCYVYDLPEGLYRIYYWFEPQGEPFYAYGDVLIDRTEENKKTKN